MAERISRQPEYADAVGISVAMKMIDQEEVEGAAVQSSRANRTNE